MEYSGGQEGTHDPTCQGPFRFPLSTTSLVGKLTMPLSLPWTAFAHGPRVATLPVSLGNCWRTNLNSAKGSISFGRTWFNSLLRPCLLLPSSGILWVRNFHCTLPLKPGGHAPAPAHQASTPNGQLRTPVGWASPALPSPLPSCIGHHLPSQNGYRPEEERAEKGVGEKEALPCQ